MYNHYAPYGYPQFGQQANGYPQNMYIPNNATAQAPCGMEVVPVSLIQQVEQVQVQRQHLNFNTGLGPVWPGCGRGICPALLHKTAQY